jgi:hypothetical protein
MKGVISFQAVDDKVYEHAAFAVGFSDPTLTVDTQATHGFVAIGEPLVVTKAEGHIIKEFNGKPAWEEYTRRLGLTSDATCGDTIPIGALGEKLSPELAKEYGNGHLLRVVTKREGNDMYYATTIQEGTPLWLTTRDEELIFTEMDRMVQVMNDRNPGKKPVAVFHADCLARGRFLFNRIIKDELVSKMQYPFYNEGACPPWLGMYGFGEFARLGGKNVYHNYELNYDNITEKTGMDCTKWLVEKWMDGAPVVDVYIHSANAIGSANMMGYINNYRHINRLPQSCVRVQWSHTVE